MELGSASRIMRRWQSLRRSVTSSVWVSVASLFVIGSRRVVFRQFSVAIPRRFALGVTSAFVRESRGRVIRPSLLRFHCGSKVHVSVIGRTSRIFASLLIAIPVGFSLSLVISGLMSLSRLPPGIPSSQGWWAVSQTCGVQIGISQEGRTGRRGGTLSNSSIPKVGTLVTHLLSTSEANKRVNRGA